MSKKASYILTGSIIAGLIILYFSYSPFQDFINETWKILWSNDEDRISSHFESFGIWGQSQLLS
ncbi:hypothetical protein NE848_02430 [Gramella jeungdoensis]|uniref:Uncharacterized protein n=1 Tax=Gramella jeungdoensis TaxID=708091 RepID=A0ABT0YYW3_9FLAO|nr:hypothetical protein [Gramella jeungdoensis]